MVSLSRCEVDCIMLVPPEALVVPLNYRRGAPKTPHAGFVVRLANQAGAHDPRGLLDFL